MRVFATSLGCPKNRVDSERFLGRLPEFVPVDDPAKAELVFINTCGFIRPAVEESIDVVLDAAAKIAQKRGGKRPLFVVGGCLVGRYGAADLAAQIPEVDHWLDPAGVNQPPQALLSALGATARGRAGEAKSYAYLKIGEGCGRSCAFCSIPSIRGRKSISEPKAALVEEARSLLDRGVRELILTAQDLTLYGLDLREKRGLLDLCAALLDLDGLARLRLLYLYPTGVGDELLAFMAATGPKLVPYFDLPFQHAHPDILQAMGRPFAVDVREIVRRIRTALPEAALRTSLIVGFPGEKKAHFDELVRFVEDIRFDHLGVFPYWREEGTKAHDLPGQVRADVKERRRNAIMELQRGISAAKLEARVGAELEVLIDGPHPEWPGLYRGRAWFQAPDIDGATYVSAPEGRRLAAGGIVRVRVESASDYDLSALLD